MYAKTSEQSSKEAQSSPFLMAVAAAQVVKDYEVWPENMPAIDLFLLVATQWRSMGRGPSGLDYNVLFKCLDRMNITPQEYDVLFADVRVIESAALTQLNAE